MVAPAGLTATLLPGIGNVRLSWGSYTAPNKAGHQVIGWRIYRNSAPSPKGTLIADEGTLGPLARSFDDVGEPVLGAPAYYTLAAVEPTDYGSRPYGEGGNVVDFGA